MPYRDQTLADLALSHPAATRVFLRNRLDFCCGGARTLAAACAHAHLDVNAIVGELERDEGGGADREEMLPVDRSQAELADHIEQRYHAALRRDVPPLIAAAAKIERVHANKPDVPVGLAALLDAFWHEMQAHMAREELVLFPALRKGTPGRSIAMPVLAMEREHELHGAALRRIRELTSDLISPPHACATWRALYDGLEQLERELMEHIHLENNVLFARAIAAA